MSLPLASSLAAAVPVYTGVVNIARTRIPVEPGRFPYTPDYPRL